MEDLEVVVTLLKNGRKSAGETRALRLYRGEYTYGIHLGHYIWPRPLPALMDSSSEGLAPHALPRLTAEGDGGAQQGLQYGLSGAV